MPNPASKINVEHGEFPFPLRDGPEESRYLTWIRNHSNYMAVRGLLDYARAVGVLVRGMAVNFLVFLPVLLLTAMAVAAYSYAEYRDRFPLVIVGAGVLYLLLPAGRRLRRWSIVVSAIPLAVIFFLSFQYWSGGGFPLTATVLLFAFAWSILFAVGTPFFKIRRYQRTIVTGSDSSVKTRDVYERSFGALVLLLLAVVSFEALAFLLPAFHDAVREQGLGFPQFGSVAAVVVAVLGAVGNRLSLRGKVARKLAISAVGLLGVVVPIVLVLYLADFIRFNRPLGGMGMMTIAALLVPIGILVALFAGWRALSWHDRTWGFVLVVVSALLMFAVTQGVTLRLLAPQSDPIGERLDAVAHSLATDSITRRTVIDRVASRDKSTLRQLPDYLDEHSAQLEDATRPFEDAARYLRSLTTPGSDATTIARKLVTDSASVTQINQLIGGQSFLACVDLRFFVRMGWTGGLTPGHWRQDLGCRLQNVRREIAAAASLTPNLVPFIYDGSDARAVRNIALQENALRVFSLALLLGFITWLTVDVNLTSIHGLYRDRLASAFLVGVDSEGDVDIEEDIDLMEICQHDAGSKAPYHLINVALNLQGSSDIGVRDRKSDYFIFSKRFIGGRRTGYCRSESMERVFPQMDLATAMAISAGAASPNMGRATNPALVAIMTLLNIRLGYWIPNPNLVERRLAGKKGKGDTVHEFYFDGSEAHEPGDHRTVFGEELIEIQRRWSNLPAPSRRLHPDNDSPIQRPTVKHGLVGIAYSGGGIRSATLNLGITQALHRSGVFDHMDYMSTVSGGGYLGSSISTLMRHMIATEDGGIAEGKHPTERRAPTNRERGSQGQLFGWRVRPSAVLREIGGKLDEKWRWVNVSDGGHIENLAAIELLRRRCRYIIIGDGEADSQHHFNGLATLIRSARIDLGVHITIDLTRLRLKPDRLSDAHWAIGRVAYPHEDELGYVLYLKSSVTGKEDEVIQQYRRSNEDFPHESTADQFFSEGQFEAYRSLGQHIGEAVLAYGPAATGRGLHPRMSYEDIDAWFAALCEVAQQPASPDR